jgi:hypothetical protein
MPERDLSDAAWFKSARSTGGGNGCVEVAFLPHGYTAVRDSKNPDGPALTFTAEQWDAFLQGAARHEFTQG